MTVRASRRAAGIVAVGCAVPFRRVLDRRQCGYRYLTGREAVRAGAFRNFLKLGRRPRLLHNHDEKRRLGYTALELWEHPMGLMFAVHLTPSNVIGHVQEVHHALRASRRAGVSIAWDTSATKTRIVGDTEWIEEGAIEELSIITGDLRPAYAHAQCALDTPEWQRHLGATDEACSRRIAAVRQRRDDYLRGHHDQNRASGGGVDWIYAPGRRAAVSAG